MAEVVGNIALKLIEAACVGVGKEIGSKALTAICPKPLPTYFPKVYKKIEKIVGQELESWTIKTVNIKIIGLVTWVKSAYIPRKDTSASNSELHQMLATEVTKLATEGIPLLQNKEYAETALGVFVIGASLHLILLQELALVDPNVEDPLESSHIVTIKHLAAEYALHAEETFKSLATSRIQHITPVSFTKILWNFHFDYISTWKDRLNGRKFALRVENEQMVAQKVETARHKYTSKKIVKLHKLSNYPNQAAQRWRLLEEHPIPREDVPRLINDQVSHCQYTDRSKSKSKKKPKMPKFKSNFSTRMYYLYMKADRVFFRKPKAITYAYDADSLAKQVIEEELNFDTFDNGASSSAEKATHEFTDSGDDNSDTGSEDDDISVCTN